MRPCVLFFTAFAFLIFWLIKTQQSSISFIFHPIIFNLPFFINSNSISAVLLNKMSSNSKDERSPSPDGSASPDIRHQKPRSKSRSPPKRSQLGSPEDDVSNPGNNLYVTGLSTRVNSNDLQTFFSKEGKVLECCLVTDPRTKESRGFAFITMETREQAERCIKHLNRSVLEGRLVTVEKAKRARGRTPTPGRYEGLRKERGGPIGRGRGQGRGQVHRRSPSYSPRRRFDTEHHYRDPHPRDRRARSRSPYGRRADDYSNAYQRRRERSSGGRSGYH